MTIISKLTSSNDAFKKSYATGAIVRMRLENFVTYDSLEFSPGSNLNVIIGPNGTGKSTIVCAICLGMTGKPAVLGRAATIADYIKYGKTKATIEIELNNRDGHNFIIKRNIFKDNKSEWFLNEKLVKLKEVEDLVNSLNIQVSNLCQFLPQEKVTEFAKMNPQELLENTEKAVGGIDLYNKHMELKDRSKISKDLERDLNIIEESLNKEKQINQRLESQVNSFLEKKKQEETIVWLKRKQACINYRIRREEYEKIKKDKDKMQKEYEELCRKCDPMNEKKTELDKQIAKQKQVITTKKNLIQETISKSQNTLKKLDDCTDKIAETKSDYLSKESEFKSQKNKLKEIQDGIESLKNEYEEAKDSLVEIQKGEEEISAKETKLRDQASKLSQKDYEFRQEIAKFKSDLESNSKKIQDLKNIREEKLAKLRQRNSSHTYSAIQWLEKNKNKFKGRFYEPFYFSINVKKPFVAKYLENAIPYNDLVNMFLFEYPEDLNTFMKEVRQDLNLIVNAALVPDPCKYKLSDFEPPVPIEQLKKFGFTTYLKDAIDAPEAVFVFCCIYHRIYSIPVGDESTQKNITNIMSQIGQYNLTRFYTDTHQYTLSKSRYTGKITTTSMQVSDSYWLTSSIDESKLTELENNGNKIINKIRELEQASNSVLKEKEKLEIMMEALREEKSKLSGRRYHFENISKKLKAKKEFLKNLESQNIDLVSEAKKMLEKIDYICIERVKIHNEYNDAIKNLIIFNKDNIAAIYQDAQFQTKKMKLENDLRTLICRKQELEPYVENYANKLKEAKEDAKSALDDASKLCGINLEKGVPESYKKKFNTLPDDPVKLESEIHQAEAVAQSTHEVDERVVQEFNNRKATIDKLTKEYDQKHTKLLSHQSNYESLKNDWLENVESMIHALNQKYSVLFQQLKCAGEVSLGRPDNPEEFSKYGVTIKVSFRTEEKLQELTAWLQSGGEKSVSTMLYMIALQEMTKCPFRVVDEINQGMDPVNERKVFDLIVQNSSSKQYAQYFLLTPKLLPDLSFDNKTNVICVFNGPSNLPHSSYDLKRFLEIRRKLNLKAEASEDLI